MPDNFKTAWEAYHLKGLGVGMAIGIIFEVFLMRNGKGKVNFPLSCLSVVAMGLMGWLSYDVAACSFPGSPWKPTVWAAGITSNTWWLCRLIVSGAMFEIMITALMPESLRKLLNEGKK
jgi:hypothetical protein